MTRKRLIALYVVGFPILFLICINVAGNWKYSETRLKGLTAGQVAGLLGTPAYAGSHGKITTAPAERDPQNFYLVYYNRENRQVQIFFENGKVVKTHKLFK